MIKTAQWILVSLGLLFLRIGFGGMMLVAHGWGKLQGFGSLSEKFPDPLGVGSRISLSLTIGAEVFCAGLLVVGFFTRLAAIPLAFCMLVALFVIHAEDDFATKEKAALYLVAYLTIAFSGGGMFSLDRLIWRGGKKKKAKKGE